MPAFELDKSVVDRIRDLAKGPAVLNGRVSALNDQQASRRAELGAECRRISPNG